MRSNQIPTQCLCEGDLPRPEERAWRTGYFAQCLRQIRSTKLERSFAAERLDHFRILRSGIPGLRRQCDELCYLHPLLGTWNYSVNFAPGLDSIQLSYTDHAC